MTGATLLAILFALVAGVYVGRPLLHRKALEPDDQRATALDEARELHARQQMLLASLKDLEDDRATDKIGEEDHDRLKSRLSAQAIEVMQRIDVLERERERSAQKERAASRPLVHPGHRRPDGSA